MYINKIDQINITLIYSQIELLFIFNMIEKDLFFIFLICCVIYTNICLQYIVQP